MPLIIVILLLYGSGSGKHVVQVPNKRAPYAFGLTVPVGLVPLEEEGSEALKSSHEVLLSPWDCDSSVSRELVGLEVLVVQVQKFVQSACLRLRNSLNSDCDQTGSDCDCGVLESRRRDAKVV